MSGNHAPIYLDYSSTTPTDPLVVEKMLPFFTNIYGNPSSTHYFGIESSKAIENAREQIATLINAYSKEVIFTSGATEANNLALRSITNFLRKQQKKHIITSKIEHKCVLEIVDYLAMEGFDVTYVGVDKLGIVDVTELESSIREDTGLISIMAVNNEIGTIQPLEHIGSLCKEHGVLFHTDAAQAVGKTPIDVNKMNIDFLSVSGHKVYGPKGIGALYINSKIMSKVKPILYGGQQELGLRPGTLPTPLCIGLGEACSLAQKNMSDETNRLFTLRNIFLDKLTDVCPSYFLNGSIDKSYSGSLSISFPGVDAEALIINLRDKLSISTGSACTATSFEPSHVLLALGLNEEQAESTVRITLGRFTTHEEVLLSVEALSKAVSSMRNILRLS